MVCEVEQVSISKRSNDTIYLCRLKVQKFLHEKKLYSKKACDLYIFYLLGRFENVDHRLTDLAKVFRNNPCKETSEDLVNAKLLTRIERELFEDNIGNIVTLFLSYTKPVSRMFH